jgi:hypothetical protein
MEDKEKGFITFTVGCKNGIFWSHRRLGLFITVRFFILLKPLG